MTSPDRLDPLGFTGAFAYVDGHVPPNVTLAAWRSRRTASNVEREQSVATPIRGAGAGADRAPQGRTLRVQGRARRPRSGRGLSPRRSPMSFLRSIGVVDEYLAPPRERREALRRLGRDGRLSAYRRGEFDLDTCCLWAEMYPQEVPLLNGEFEFIAVKTPEVCEP